MTSPLLTQPSYPTAHTLTPDGKVAPGDMGPRALPFNLNVSSTAPASFDLTRELEAPQIANIQAVFIDNSLNASPATVASSEIPGMDITIAPNSQGVFPFFGKTFSTITVTTTNAAATPIGVVFLNTPQPYASWKCV